MYMSVITHSTYKYDRQKQNQRHCQLLHYFKQEAVLVSANVITVHVL